MGQNSVPFLIHIDANRKEENHADSTMAARDTNPADHIDHAAPSLTASFCGANNTITFNTNLTGDD
jgi:hypothetical protein